MQHLNKVFDPFLITHDHVSVKFSATTIDRFEDTFLKR